MFFYVKYLFVTQNTQPQLTGMVSLLLESQLLCVTSHSVLLLANFEKSNKLNSFYTITR